VKKLPKEKGFPKKKVSTRDLVLHILIKYPGTPIKPIKSRLEKHFDRERSRTRVEQILNDLERQGIVVKERGVKDRRQVLCSINPNKIDSEFFTIIKDLDGNPVAIYDDEGTIFDTRFKYKIEHDLPDELDELYDELKIIRDRYFNRAPPTIADANRWFPDYWDAALIEDLLTKINTYLCARA